MSKKGFTLIELLAVMALLAIVVLITVPNIVGLLNTSRSDLTRQQELQIEKAARNWGTSNLYLEKNEPNIKYVTIGDLKKSGFLENKTINQLENNEVISDEVRVCIEYNNNQYNYVLNGDC